jgi:hypothetical protein
MVVGMFVVVVEGLSGVKVVSYVCLPFLLVSRSISILDFILVLNGM